MKIILMQRHSKDLETKFKILKSGGPTKENQRRRGGTTEIKENAEKGMAK